jgi:hypothetical protein
MKIIDLKVSQTLESVSVAKYLVVNKNEDAVSYCPMGHPGHPGIIILACCLGGVE